jgi:hypothetical protein
LGKLLEEAVYVVPVLIGLYVLAAVAKYVEAGIEQLSRIADALESLNETETNRHVRELQE